MLCKVCNKEFKRLTASHIKKHGLTYEEYQRQYESEAYDEKQKREVVIKFFDDFYITTRYKFLKYLPSKDGAPITVNVHDNKALNDNEGTNRRTYYLTDSDLHAHLQGKETIGIFFPNGFTKLIGLDIDRNDKELLYRLVMFLNANGIDEKCMLISSSGGKGYHVDIFLSVLLPQVIVDNFHQVILDTLNVTNDIIELRGGTSKAGYKLPLGVHFKTGCFCDICDVKGNRVQNYLDVLKTRERVDKNVITGITKDVYEPYMTDEEQYKKQELLDSAKLLRQYANTPKDKIESIKKLLKNGVHETGYRNNSVYKVALYLKDQGYCLAETKEEVFNWIQEKWSKSVVDNEMLKQAKTTIENVYKNDSPFLAGPRDITISDIEIREVLSVKTKNKLQTKALTRLYYVLAIHSKAYADEKGNFYMTYEQMAEAGLNADRRDLKRQIEKLAELGKVIIKRSGESQKRSYKKLPNQYMLPAFIPNTVRIESKTAFTLCQQEAKCVDCLERAYCHLLPARERAKYLKGKEYKSLEKCPYNE
ncbi:hypothetical protein HUC00_28655 [Bacillus mycoides]|nr:hypothetical protein [Bacillus mycoides]